MTAGEDPSDSGSALEEARVGVVERLRARHLEIDQAIFARIRDMAPDAVGLGDPEYVAGLRAAITAAVDFVLEGIEQGVEYSPRVPSAAVTQARRAARTGVGLDTLLRRYVAGHAILEDFVMQEVDHSDLLDQRTALRRVLEASASLLDRLIPSITSAYMQELEQAGASSVRRGHAPAQDRRKQSSYRTRAIADGDESTSIADGDGSTVSHEQVEREQRVRILRALVEVLAERGFAGATVGLVVARARVSRRTFYVLFDGLEDALVAFMDSVLEQAAALASHELEEAQSWQDGLRSALAAVLMFFDSEPELARACIVETLAGGPIVLEHRERVIAAFRLPIIEWVEKEVSPVSPLAAEGVVGSVIGIMHAHIVARKPGLFIELLGPLMGLVTAPYVGARSMERQIEQGDELARAILTGDSRWAPSAQAAGLEMDAALPAMLGNPSARRARECLIFLAEHPDSSNREIALGIDIAHQSQISKLLAYLSQEGLATKCSEGAGKRNSWRLTPRGEEIARALVDQAD